jgi:cyclopropane fatty-acyl-phospholipid synthase-like methyltransferase
MVLVVISEGYVEINKQLHLSKPTYGMSGHRWADEAVHTASVYDCQTILDYGCGKGTFKKAVEKTGRTVFEYDPAIDGKDELPAPADLVVCTDVMEHVEPDQLDSVLTHIRNLANKKVLMTVATRPAKKTLSDGRNAHLIIEDFSWWKDELDKYFHINKVEVDVKNEGEFVCLLTPRGAYETI